MPAGFTPGTQHDTGRARAATRLEQHGHRAVQLPSMAQPMVHPPTATRATAVLPRPSSFKPTKSSADPRNPFPIDLVSINAMLGLWHKNV
jgi:hypothetical protein